MHYAATGTAKKTWCTLLQNNHNKHRLHYARQTKVVGKHVFSPHFVVWWGHIKLLRNKTKWAYGAKVRQDKPTYGETKLEDAVEYKRFSFCRSKLVDCSSGMMRWPCQTTLRTDGIRYLRCDYCQLSILIDRRDRKLLPVTLIAMYSMYLLARSIWQNN